MVDDVGEAASFAIYPGLFQRIVEHSSRRSDEWMALDIFAITRLLADQHHFGARRPFAENRLRSALPDIASAAKLHRVPQIIERRIRLDQIGGARPLLFFPPPLADNNPAPQNTPRMP